MIARLSALAGRHADTLREFAGYVAVSGTAFCVDFAIYCSLLGATRYAFLAAVGGYLCGVSTHYALSSRIVFRRRFDKRGVIEEAPALAKFFTAGFAGLAVTALVVGLIADVAGGNPLVAKIAAAGCSFIVVFTLLRVLVFRGRPVGLAQSA